MWFALALFYALWASINLTVIKKILSSLDSLTALFLSLLFTLPFSFAIVYLTSGIPHANLNFFQSIIIAGVLDVIAFVASFWALKSSPISEIAPLSSITPIFTAILAIFLLKEVPTLPKIIGIIIIVIGTYFLNISQVKNGILAPVKKLFQSRGVQLYFFANLLWSITPVLQKNAILNTIPKTPMFASLVDFSVIVILLLPFAIQRIRIKKINIKRYFWIFLLLGFFSALSQYAAYTAFSLTYVGYANATFKFSSVFMIFLGFIFFKEKNIKEKLLGAAIMLIGAVIVAI
jgi:drug/metabolite transporter (DMT)-like permease